LQLVFLFIGTGIAAASRNPHISASATTTVLLVSFILSAVIDMNSRLEGLKYLTPFKYFEAKNMMYGGGIDLVFILLSLAIIAILVGVTYVFYNKRDLNV